MKGKRLLILGAALALGLSACAGAVRVTRTTPLKDGEPVRGVSYSWEKMTSVNEFVDGVTILITQDSYYLNVSGTGADQTPRQGSLTLSDGLPTLTANNANCFVVSGSGSSIKLAKATDTSKWLITGSSNNAMRINTGTTGHYWTISSAGTEQFYLMSNQSRYLSRYSTTDFRSYTNTSTNANLVIYKLVGTETSAQVVSVSASIGSRKYYTGSTLAASDFDVTVSWSEGEPDTQ